MLCGYFVLCVFRCLTHVLSLICTIRKKEKHILIICQNVQKAKEAIFSLIGNCTNYWQPNISTQFLKCQINNNEKKKFKFRTRWAALMFLQTKYLNFSLSWKRGAEIAACRRKRQIGILRLNLHLICFPEGMLACSASVRLSDVDLWQWRSVTLRYSSRLLLSKDALAFHPVHDQRKQVYRR